MKFPIRFALAVAIGSQMFADDLARIYVYSQRDTPARAWMPVFCDQTTAADIRRGYFFAINLTAGKHALLAGDGVPLTIDVGANEELFLRLDWNHQIGRQPIPVLSKVPAGVATAEMRFLSYTYKKRIQSASVSPADPRPQVELRLRTRTK